MSLTEDEVEMICLLRHSPHASEEVSAAIYAMQAYRYNRLEARARRLLPLWRKWSIERERLWFALIGLGLDIEGDERDMPRAEMRRRIERARHGLRRHHVEFVLRELDQ